MDQSFHPDWTAYVWEQPRIVFAILLIFESLALGFWVRPWLKRAHERLKGRSWAVRLGSIALFFGQAAALIAGWSMMQPNHPIAIREGAAFDTGLGFSPDQVLSMYVAVPTGLLIVATPLLWLPLLWRSSRSLVGKLIWCSLALALSTTWISSFQPSLGHPRWIGWRMGCHSRIMSLPTYLVLSHNDRIRTLRERDPNAELTANETALTTDGVGGPLYSWRVQISPLSYAFGSQPSNYRIDQPWDSPENLIVARSINEGNLNCGARPKDRLRDANGILYTDYVAIVGEQTAFRRRDQLPMTRMADGASNTICITEASGLNVPWSQPRDFDWDGGLPTVNVRGPQPHTSPSAISSYHLGGGHAVCLDGRVIAVSQKIDRRVLQAAFTADGGEPPLDRSSER